MAVVMELLLTAERRQTSQTQASQGNGARFGGRSDGDQAAVDLNETIGLIADAAAAGCGTASNRNSMNSPGVLAEHPDWVRSAAYRTGDQESSGS